MTKGEIATDEQFLLWPQCFQLYLTIKLSFMDIIQVLNVVCCIFVVCGKGLQWYKAGNWYTLSHKSSGKIRVEMGTFSFSPQCCRHTLFAISFEGSGKYLKNTVKYYVILYFLMFHNDDNNNDNVPVEYIKMIHTNIYNIYSIYIKCVSIRMNWNISYLLNVH